MAFSNPGWPEGVPQTQPGEEAPTHAEVPSGTSYMYSTPTGMNRASGTHSCFGFAFPGFAPAVTK